MSLSFNGSLNEEVLIDKTAGTITFPETFCVFDENGANYNTTEKQIISLICKDFSDTLRASSGGVLILNKTTKEIRNLHWATWNTTALTNEWLTFGFVKRSTASTSNVGDIQIQGFFKYRIIGEDVFEKEMASEALAYTLGSNAAGKTVKRFVIGWCSDIHASGANGRGWADNLNQYISMYNGTAFGGKVDYLLCTGDISNGFPARAKETTLSEIRSVITKLSAQSIISSCVIGNHDDNIERSGGPNSYAQSISKEEQYEEIIKPFSDKFPAIKTVEGKGYYYVDFENDKVRVIVLDCIDFPIEPSTIDPTAMKYVTGFLYSQEQLDWLYNKLLTTPADYAVILVNHGAHAEGISVGGYAQGLDTIPSILAAYRDGGSYEHSWDGGYYPELATYKVFDFTGNGEREVIAELAGHCHTREIRENQGIKILTCPNMYGENPPIDGSLFDSGVNLLIRATNLPTQNTFNTLSIDRSRRKIYLTAFGAYRDVNGHITERTSIIDY